MRPADFRNEETFVSTTPQPVYDAFNTFIFSADQKVFSKLIAKAMLISMVQSVPGDIVEAGVFRGSGMAAWLKVREAVCPSSFRKVVGFDLFDYDAIQAAVTDPNDAQRLRALFDERGHRVTSESVRRSLYSAGFDDANFELISGDISVSAQAFCDARPGFVVSLLHIDLDVAEATYGALKALWPRVHPGGIVVFDDYAVHQWSEVEGAAKFFKEIGHGGRAETLPFPSPTAMVRKMTW